MHLYKLNHQWLGQCVWHQALIQSNDDLVRNKLKKKKKKEAFENLISKIWDIFVNLPRLNVTSTILYRKHITPDTVSYQQTDSITRHGDQTPYTPPHNNSMVYMHEWVNICQSQCILSKQEVTYLVHSMFTYGVLPLHVTDSFSIQQWEMTMSQGHTRFGHIVPQSNFPPYLVT